MENVDEVLLEAEASMEKAVEFLQQELNGVRTGKASPNLVENVQVEYYGTTTRLRDLAGISTPEARLIVISPFDPTAIDAVEKAITAANLGITPMNDGRLIRLPIPDLSEERRAEMVKMAKRMTEEQRVAVRNVRRDHNDVVKSLQKNGKITEDQRDDALGEIQKLTDTYISRIDEMINAKEKDISSV
jgi:ribosome recycling factor